MSGLQSWGRFPKAEQTVQRTDWRDEPLRIAVGRSVLPRGLGRSYGDVCLNDGGVLLSTVGLDRFISFDLATGVLTAEAGVSLAEILEVFAPKGWFPPVVPGTKFVTLGGAVANDIHGKNHHREGTFGRHVTHLELVRSDGTRLACSPSENADWFGASIGGLGLTGLITEVSVRLRRIPSEYVDWETIPFANVESFLEIAGRSDSDWEYTVAWIDCLSRGNSLGRGLFYRGNHTTAPVGAHRRGKSRLFVPCDFPEIALNRTTVKAFNLAYSAKARLGPLRRVVHYEPFFFPLDGVGDWNRIYGRRGLLQFQCVVPYDRGPAGLRALLDAIARSGQGSFLAVLKTFGAVPSPGLLSFPRPGATLALDFANRGAQTVRLFGELEQLVLEQGGALYPAKDALMSRAMFEASFPSSAELQRFIDPAFSSSFWRRVAPRG